MRIYEKFESVITKKFHVQEYTTRHNTLCSYSGCYSNCDPNCYLNFTIDPSHLSGCGAMSNGRCTRCGHGQYYHRHYNSLWKLVDDRQVVVDHMAKARFKSALDEKTRKGQLMAALQRARDNLTKAIGEETIELEKLVTEYAGLSLTGSFSGQVDKSVKLMELSLQGMLESGADEDTIKKMEQSSETSRARLRLLTSGKSSS